MKDEKLESKKTNRNFRIWGLVDETLEKKVNKKPDTHPLNILKRWDFIANRIELNDFHIFLKLAKKFVKDDFMDENEKKIFKKMCAKGISDPEYITKTSRIILNYWIKTIEIEKTKNTKHVWKDFTLDKKLELVYQISNDFCKEMKIPKAPIEILEESRKKNIFTHTSETAEDKIVIHLGDLHYINHLISLVSHELVHYYEHYIFVKRTHNTKYARLYNINRKYFIHVDNNKHTRAHRWQPKEILANMVGDMVLDISREKISLNGLVAEQNLDLFKYLTVMRKDMHKINKSEEKLVKSVEKEKNNSKK